MQATGKALAKLKEPDPAIVGVNAMNPASPAPNGPAACCSTDNSPARVPKTEWGGRIAAIAAVVLAFLASQHHTIMMTLFAFGLSNTAMSFMTAAPLVRDAMLGMSLVMIAVVAWQIKDKRRPRSVRVTGAVSIVATLALAAWSIVQFGL
jgi:hypothetical protein